MSPVQEEKPKIVAYDDIPVGGGGGGKLPKGEVIEIDYDWGDPPPRITKRFGKKKGKDGKKKGTNKEKAEESSEEEIAVVK